MKYINLIGLIFLNLSSFQCSAKLNRLDSYFRISDLKNYKLALPSNPNRQTEFAAEALTSEIKSVFGFNLATSTYNRATNKFISIGDTREWLTLVNEKRIKIFESGESCIYFVDGNIYLNGSDSRDLFNAIYSFLEKDLGIYYLGENCYTRLKGLNEKLMPKSRIEKPAFGNRSVFYSNCLDPFYGSRNNLNLLYDRNLLLDAVGANDIVGPSGTHTYDQLVPKRKYYYSKPNLFSDKNDNNRNINNCVQLCLSDKEVLEIAYASIIDYMKAYPETKFINIAPNDCKNTCTCDNCKKINSEEYSNFGTLARFLNIMSDKLKRSYKDINLITLSYLDLYEAPKKTRLRENIIVRISTDTVSWYEPFKNIRRNVKFKERVNKWKSVCSNLWVYDYTCNFEDYFNIRPNIYVIADNIKYYYESGFKGVTLESFYENKGVEESELRAFVFSKLLCDPSLSVDNLISLFCFNYYGNEAGEIIKGYYNYLYHQKSFEKINYKNFNSMFNIEDIKYFDSVIHDIESIKLDSDKKKRINRWLLSLKYTLIKDYNDLISPKDYIRYLQDFERSMSDNSFVKLGSFKPNMDEFIRVHKIKSQFAGNNKTREIDTHKIVDPTFFIINNPLNDSIEYPFIVADDKATNGIAIRIPANNQDWLVRFLPDKDFCDQYSNTSINLRIRYTGNYPLGDESIWVYCFGAYNYLTYERPIERYITLKDVKEYYTTFNFGNISLKEGLIFYIFPILNSNLESLTLDCIEFK